MDPYGDAVLVVIIQTTKIQYFERILLRNFRPRKESQQNAINPPKINCLDNRKQS
jgi:hypothetical protein